MDDTPLPLCLLNKLPCRARGFIQKTGMTCRSFLDLAWETASSHHNVGKKTWADMEALKPELRRAMEKAVSPDAEGMFQLNRKSFAGFDGYLAAFLDFYPPIRGCEMIFKHRLGLVGGAKPESLEVTRTRFNPVLTRERVRQMSEAITSRWFNDDSRCLAADFLAKAEAILDSRGGALPVAELTAALEEDSGWARTPNPARMARFLRLFKAVDYYPKLQIVSSRDFGKAGKTARLAELFEAFCADEKRAFSEIDYAAFKALAPEASYQAYQLLAFNLLLGDNLPLDKKRQLKAFATMGRLTFRDAGDARPVASKLLEALRIHRAPATPNEWLRKARALFPGEDFEIVQVRRMASGYPEVVHYDRGKFIWHEFVSLPPGIAREAENHFTAHLQKHGIDACSVFRYYTSRQFELAAAGIVSQTLFYFLLKSSLSGALDFPEYPKVARPGGDGGTGAFDRAILRRFGANREIVKAGFEQFYTDVLCGDPRQIKWHLQKFRKSCAAQNAELAGE